MRAIAIASCLIVLGADNASATECAADSVTFTCGELLGRPTDHSIAINLCADKAIDVYVEYGTAPGSYQDQTISKTLQSGVAATLAIATLAPNTRYYYRVRYRVTGTTEFLARAEHTFHTARPVGSGFTFAIEADPHLDSATNPDLYKRTLANMAASGPDFMIDLGDIFMSEKLPVINQSTITARHLLVRSMVDTACHSVPLMLTIGNHEGELGWLLDGTPDNLPVWASMIRNAYYPNPMPDGFYTGDTTRESFVGERNNYYAWQWGDALFIVLDPYWYTGTKPAMSKSNWEWTLGKTQYDWLKRTLESSKAGYKFVFAHQLVGGNNTDGRGGIEAVPFYEMGGYNADSTWGFDAHRPGWAKPIHRLFVDNHVSAYFHGHDHVFVKQDLDSVVYQEVPQPGFYNFTNPTKSYSGANQATAYGYTHGTVFPSSGFLRVNVGDSVATVEYVRSYMPQHENATQRNGAVAYSYTVRKYAGTSSVDRGAEPVGTFALAQNFPNPCSPTTAFAYDLPQRGHVTLTVYDMLGRQVASIVDAEQEAGRNIAEWNAAGYAPGLYIYKLAMADQMMARTMRVVR